MRNDLLWISVCSPGRATSSTAFLSCDLCIVLMMSPLATIRNEEIMDNCPQTKRGQAHLSQNYRYLCSNVRSRRSWKIIFWKNYLRKVTCRLLLYSCRRLPSAISKPSFASPRRQIEAISHKRFTHQSVARTQCATHWIKNSRYGKYKETAAGSGTFDICIQTGTNELQAHVHRGVEALDASHW